MTNWTIVFQLVVVAIVALTILALIARATWMRPAERAEIEKKAEAYEAEQAKESVVYPIIRD